MRAFFRAFPAEKRATRSGAAKVPNPTKVTGSPFFKDLVIPSKRESMVAAACVFDRPQSSAIFAARSRFVTRRF